MFGENVNSIMKTFTKAITKLEKLQAKEEIKAGECQTKLVDLKTKRIKKVLSARDIYLNSVKQANESKVKNTEKIEREKAEAMSEMIRSGNAINALKKLTGGDA